MNPVFFDWGIGRGREGEGERGRERGKGGGLGREKVIHYQLFIVASY